MLMCECFVDDDDPEIVNKKNADGANKRKNGDLNFSELNDSFEDIATNEIYKLILFSQLQRKYFSI